MAQRSMVAGTYAVSLFGREILKAGRKKREFYLKNAVQYWRAAGFPHVRLSASDVRAQFRYVLNAPLEPLADGHILGTSCVGLRLANSYHPQMWDATSHRHRRSPLDYFRDDDHLQTMLQRAPRFWPNTRCWSAQAVRNLVRIYSGGRVANFRPVVARSIINHFSRDGDVVLDFSAGYGGRLLACLTLDRHYIGIDPARRQVTGLTRMIQELQSLSRARAEIRKGCAEEILPTMGRNSVDLVFSSPPFYNLEVYSQEVNQSARRYPTYPLWRTHFLETVITQSSRLLRRRGYFAINVSTRGRHSLGQDTLAIASKHLAYCATIHVMMSARPLQRARKIRSYRTEPIYVFQKR